MRIWSIIILLILGILLVKEFITITIPYSYTGNRIESVQQGLDTWSVAGINFIHNPKAAKLFITHNTPEQFELSMTAAGENVGNKIRISTRYPRTESDIIGIVSHEVGHYFGLPHNTETNSVMNPDLPLTKRPSEMDIRRAEWQKLFMLLQNIF